MSIDADPPGIETVRSMWDSIGRRDAEGFLDCFTEDAEMHSAWADLEGVGPYVGREGLRVWWNGFLLDTVETYRGVVEQAISLDDLMLALVRVDGAGRSGSFQISRVVGQLFRFDADRISRLSVHLDPAGAFTEAGTELARGEPAGR